MQVGLVVVGEFMYLQPSFLCQKQPIHQVHILLCCFFKEPHSHRRNQVAASLLQG